MPGVFAGGDCATGPSTVISAIAAGKVIAANIDEYLGYHHEITADVEIPEPKLEDKPACGRVNLTEREAGERVKDLNGHLPNAHNTIPAAHKTSIGIFKKKGRGGKGCDG